MKLLNILVEETLEKSPLIKQIASLMHELAIEVHTLGVAVDALAKVVTAHEVALQRISAQQQLLLQKLQSGSIDMSMPTGKKKESADKPN